jgi:hypothetical protein
MTSQVVLMLTILVVSLGTFCVTRNVVILLPVATIQVATQFPASSVGVCQGKTLKQPCQIQ